MTGRAAATGLPRPDQHLRSAPPAPDEQPGQRDRDPRITPPDRHTATATRQHQRHRHLAAGRASAQRRGQQTGLAVVVRVDATPDDVDRCWHMFLRRFDIEHTFRLFKQTSGWTRPRLRDPQAADRWTWLLLVVHTQLRLARSLVADLRRPWERPTSPARLTSARVRREFRNIHTKTARPAAAPKPTRPGPGRPPGSKNRVATQRFDVGRILATGDAYTRPAHHKKGTKPRRTA
jgi:hypothetical protein